MYSEGPGSGGGNKKLNVTSKDERPYIVGDYYNGPKGGNTRSDVRLTIIRRVFRES